LLLSFVTLGIRTLATKVRTMADAEAPEGFEDGTGFYCAKSSQPNIGISSPSCGHEYSTPPQENIIDHVFRPPFHEAAI